MVCVEPVININNSLLEGTCYDEVIYYA